jgi:hypothetical protein
MKYSGKETRPKTENNSPFVGFEIDKEFFGGLR